MRRTGKGDLAGGRTGDRDLDVVDLGWAAGRHPAPAGASEDQRPPRRAGEGEAAQGHPTLTSLSAPDAVARTAGARQSESYAYSSAAVHHLAERYGRQAVLDLYSAFGDESIPGKPGDPRTTDRVLRATLGLPLRRLERDLEAWVAARGGT